MTFPELGTASPSSRFNRLVLPSVCDVEKDATDTDMR